MPRFSEDPVVDFAVLEAVVTRSVLEDNKRAEEQKDAEERNSWRGKAGRKAWAKEQGLA